MLCKALELTERAGLPFELFNLIGDETLQTKHEVHSFTQLQEKLWRKGSSANLIFGIKHSGFTTLFNKIEIELLELYQSEFETEISIKEIYEHLFPNCKHIYLTRPKQNKTSSFLVESNK